MAAAVAEPRFSFEKQKIESRENLLDSVNLLQKEMTGQFIRFDNHTTLKFSARAWSAVTVPKTIPDLNAPLLDFVVETILPQSVDAASDHIADWTYWLQTSLGQLPKLLKAEQSRAQLEREITQRLHDVKTLQAEVHVLLLEEELDCQSISEHMLLLQKHQQEISCAQAKLVPLFLEIELNSARSHDLAKTIGDVIYRAQRNDQDVRAVATAALMSRKRPREESSSSICCLKRGKN